MAPKLVSLRSAYKSRRVGSSYIQILGTGMDTGDCSPSLLLFFDNKRFLFNAGEGIQRFCIEHKIKLSKIDHVLFTRVYPETTGGLFGMLLTLAGETRLTANIWGPSDLQHLLSAIRTFLPFSSTLHTHIIEPESMSEGAVVLEEDVVKISGFPLQADFKERSGGIAMVYVCQLPDISGRFDPAKAASLGVKPGRKYSLLQDGMTVESDDGQRTVHPSDVMEPSKPGPIFILVDCPTVSHIAALISLKVLQKFWNEDTADISSLACIVHISPLSVIEETSYTNWMTRFGTVQHILAGPGCCKRSHIFRTSASMVAKLNLLCPSVFPINIETEMDFEEGVDSVRGINVLAGHNLLKFHLHPVSLRGLEKASAVEEFSLEAIQREFVSETPELKAVKEELAELWEASNRTHENVPACISGRADEMEVVFLGTGSSHPCKHRNVSAIYLHLFKRGGMLLDCGEDTYGQLKRRYGTEGADSVITSLKCIWISHIHADHQSGLARLLAARKTLLQKQGRLERILLIGPKLLRRFLTPYDQLEDLAINFLDCSQTTIDAVDTDAITNNSVEDHDSSSSTAVKKCCTGESSSSGCQLRGSECTGKRKIAKQFSSGESGCHLSSGLDDSGRKKMKEVLLQMGMKSLQSVQVIHCPYAYGVVVEALAESSHPGWKFAYSGDTRPCEAFVEAAKGSTVFIHEATFDDGLLEDALEKNHSLTCEAVQAGAAAGAYRTILTHFSQRYPRIPVFDESYNESTCVAFDMMSINLVDLPLLPKLVPAFKLLFKEEAEDLK